MLDVPSTMLDDDDKVIYQTCPCCRHRFRYTDPTAIKKGPWSLTKTSTFYNDVYVRINKTYSLILYTLAARTMPTTAERLGYIICSPDADDVRNIACVQICKLRRTLKKLNLPSPIVTMGRQGYVWNHLTIDERLG